MQFKTTFNKLFNVFLRLGGIGSKFIIITLMSKYFDVDVFGNYGLILSTITLLIFILGLDFYNFSIRDILKSSRLQENVNKVISSILLYIFTYIIFIFLGYFFLREITYIKPFIFLIIFLGISEHLSQEIYRLLIGFKKVLLANILLFIRTFGWGSVIIFDYYYGNNITIEKILKLWMFTNFLTILYVFVYVVFNNFKNILNYKININWIKKGMKISSFFFVATISLKLIEYANRYIVDYFMGEELAGIFLFYSNISILITVYVNTIVISFELPDLISFSNTTKIFQLLKNFKKNLLIHTVLSSIFILLIIKPLLIWQDKEEFQNYLPLIYFFVFGVALMNYSLLYHFKLYIYHKDKSLLKSLVISAIISIIITIIFSYLLGVYGTAIAFVLTSLTLFYLRYFEAKKIIYD